MSQSTSQDYHILPVTPAQLKAFLTEAPLMYKGRLSEGAKKHILTNSYRSLWSNDSTHMQKYFFPEEDCDNLSQILEKYNLFGSQQETNHEESNEQNFSKNNDDEPEYWESQRGKQCGHLFKKGESLYRCRNCGLDDTCVMCSKCFHSTNHEGHDVKIWISRGAGGCCDCGDPEAWKVPMICSIHSNISNNNNSNSVQSLEPISSVPPVIIDSVRDTITVVLDYILETFATSPEDVVSVGSVDSIQQDCLVSHQALGLPVNDPNQTYACVLWNDEKHSFDAVINIVMEAIQCSKEEAAHAAECVDIYGRHVVKESTNIEYLIQVANKISSINLAVTISSSQKAIREEIAGLLLDWLKELTGGRYRFFNNVDGGNCIIRDIICQVLAKDWALRPDLAWLSTRYRRERMPDTEEDETMDEQDEEMMFGEDVDEIDQDILLDQDQIEDFFNRIAGGEEVEIEEDDDDDEEEEEEEDSSSDQYEEAEEHNSIDLDLDSDMTDAPMEMNSAVESPTQEEVQRRRRSEAQGSTVEASSSQGRKSDALKRRRLSGSSQSKATKTQKSRDILDIDWSLDAWVEYTEKLEAEERALSQQLGVAAAPDDDQRTINANLKKEFRRKLRLDYLLQFDLRLWKTARISIKDLLIGTLISNFEYRPILGIRFARNYPELVDAFFFKDREPEHSIGTLSVQLLTVPTVASTLVKEYKFFGMVCCILENFFLTDHVRMLLPEEYARAQVDCSSRAIARHRYAYTIYDLRYVMNAEQVKVEIAKNPIYLRHLLNLLYQFQEMDALERQTDKHVEFESRSWIAAFNITLQTSKLCRLLAGCFDTVDIDTSRNLCRTIYRVLKEIADWNPVLLPRKTDDETPDTRVLIRGLNEQEFHSVSTANAGVYEIVKYDIAKEPVSFHHPLHWLLSELFENVALLNDSVLNQLGWVNGFNQMVNNAYPRNDHHDMFLIALEYPIRTLAWLSQINCGLWVRNGYGIRNQLLSYKDVNVRENTLDCDIYLIQVGLTVCDSNQILLTIMDRFQLVDWFRGKYNKPSCYDSNQLVFMIEDFLNLLVVCATEHGYASGTTIEQRIRQSIIQFLGISSMSYSELLKLIPESLTEHESFENQLNMIANFKAPDGLNDKGLYEIKPEYIDEIDPYYWHYTRNQREEAQTVLKNRWNQLHPTQQLSDKDEYLLIPRVNKIESGPFKQLGKYLHSHVFCQIIAYALWDAKFHKKARTDIILDIALYLAMVAVLDRNSAASALAQLNVKGKYRADAYIDESNTKHFSEFAETDTFSIQINEIERTQSTLLGILLRCLDDKDLSHAHKRLGFIVDKIEMHASEGTKELIAAWKERRSSQVNAASMDHSANDVSEYEKKKAAAKARQAAIMSQFANAQSKFMEQHADLYVSDEDEDIQETYEEPYSNNNNADLGSENDFEVVRKCHFPTDNCIVCQEELNDSKIYGMLGFIQKANMHRLTPMNNQNILADILESSTHDNPWAPREENTKTPFAGFPTDAHISGLDISSCGHLMHSECFKTYQKSTQNQFFSDLNRIFPLAIPLKTRFLCPLCKALGNVLVPIVWKGKKEAYPGVMAPTTAYSELGNTIKDIAAELQEKFERIPGSFTASPRFTNTVPNLVVNDQDALEQLYKEIIRVADRLLEDGKPGTLQDNFLHSVRNLYDMYANTIGDFEIAQRGTEGTRARDLTVEYTGTFIDDISNTSQTLLKILSMTNTLVPNLMNSAWDAEHRNTKEKMALLAINQFIPNTVNTNDALKTDRFKPMLMDDPFKVLVRFSLAFNDTPSIEVHHVLRYLYIAELAKIILAIVRGFLDEEKLLKQDNLSQLLNTLNANEQHVVGVEGVHQFTHYILGLLKVPQTTIDHFFQMVKPGALITLVRMFALPFLRKSFLFMVVHHGFIPQSPSADMEEKSEYERLLDILKLSTFDSVFELEAFERSLVNDWCLDYAEYNSTLLPISLNLPTQYRMTTLPYVFDDLIDESLKRVCKKCKTVPEHSAICLICGTFVCARRFCCTEDGKGECNVHMKNCGGEIGIYIMIKDCFLLLLHDNGGYIMNAPYLDSHGEADIFLKRGARQYLNTKRYEQIRQMWLNQSIPSFVRRKMEVAYTSTIWEAF